MFDPKKFKNPPLRDMVAVGRVEPDEVVLWMRSERPGPLQIRWWREDRREPPQTLIMEIPEKNDRDNTQALRLPGGEGRLEPLCRYWFQVTHRTDGHTVGEGRFETAPESPSQTPPRFALAITSCHQPFDKRGTLREKSSLMLVAARKCLERHRTKVVITLGDQMYSDLPKQLSLLDSDYFQRIAPAGRRSLNECSVEEVRRIYQDRYRRFWNHPEWQRLHREFPCYPILDDHDLVDNWGAHPVYETPEWQNVGAGARRAYLDYQGSRVLPPAGDGLPPSFHYSFAYGNIAAFVMDLRSERLAGENGQLYSDRQEADLRDFLRQHGDRKVIFLVLSVPIVHLPRFLAKIVARLPHAGEDFSDRWSSGSHLRDRDRLLRILHDHQGSHPHQKLVLLSGDIHIGCVHVVRWKDGTPSLHQLISSPITNQTGLLVQLASKALITANRCIATDDESLAATVRPLKGESKGMHNPFGKLNLGLVEVETPAPDAEPRLRFLLYGSNGGEPVCVYRSPPI